MRIVIIGLTLMLAGFIDTVWAGPAPLGLGEAISYANNNDPWLKGNELNERALLAESIADGELPDPRLSLGLLNLATDTLDFDQEPMSQFKLGLAQKFPRGDTLKLQRRIKREQSAAYPFLRDDRKARVALTVSLLWFDAFLAQQSVALIENNRHLFEQLIDIVHANYTATSGSTRQQDVIRAELELSRLKARLSLLWQDHDAAQQALGEWLSEALVNRVLRDNLQSNLQKNGLAPMTLENKRQTMAGIVKHPRVRALDRNIESVATRLELARQQYKPEWAINAAYAYRDEAPSGNERADFVSMSITVDLPLFTANRQDQRVLAASHRRAAAQTERDLLLRELRSAYEQAGAELLRVDEQEQLYQQYLLPQMHDQADATLAAYTTDGGDFAEVMRARIAELNTKIMALQLSVKRQKILAKMHYFMVGADVKIANVNDVHINDALRKK
ncbi:MAG: TolC family protein [Gammaproteobacteria bacterium]|nr:TolC family protein [Gammaproteobacteria bacterium]MBQ0838977.1 TolC family protein [Gammaproteobacteria bacterium]